MTDSSVTAELLVSIYDGIILHRLFEGGGDERESLRQATQQILTSGLIVRG